MKSKTVERIQEKMKNDSWYNKLKRWFIVEVWCYTLLLKKYLNKK